MKFVADGMLGKLVRWLRILGHDVEYSTSFDDDQLISIAKREKRILLTRDFELYKHAIAKDIDAFYLEGKTREEKLAELARRFRLELDVDMEVSRCPKCNTKVKPVPKEDVVGKIERKTLVHYDSYWECPKCGQIYWQGAHWKKIRKTLEKAESIKTTLEK